MRKISKVLIIALILLVAVSLFSTVRASNKELLAYIRNVHNINGMLWELSNDDKVKLEGFAAKLDDATSDSIMNDIIAAENVVRSSGVTNHNDLTAEQRAQIVSYAQSAAKKAGATLTVDLNNRTFQLTKNGKTVIAKKSIDSIVVDPGTGSGGSGSGSAAKASSAKTGAGRKLLYTGSNYAVYAVSAVAIVAVALVVKKRRV